MKILPRTKTPDLSLDTVGGERWTLSESKPENLTLLVFYRGDHCPLCKKQLREFEAIHDKFEKRGIDVIAISANARELAEKSVREWELQKLKVAYGLPIETAREWDLFISAAAKDNEPAHFSEPGLFVIKPDGTLYASAIQTMPFSRPSAEQIYNSLDYIVEKGYPARGEA